MRFVARLRALVLPALVSAALLLTASTALAQAPTLKNRVTDQTGVLGSDVAMVEAAIASLSDSANVDLWVLFVSTTDGTPTPEYATEVYQANGFGGNDMLLVVAVDDHRYGWYELNASGLSTDALNALSSKTLDPSFRQGNYARGVVDFTVALSQAVLGAPVDTSKPVGPVVTPEVPAGGSTGGSGSGGPDLGGVLLFFAVLGIIFVVVVLVAGIRAWRLSKLPAEERDRQTGDLARQANKLLVDTDDAVTEAKQELGFAQAEFTATDTAPFEAAISKAEDELKQAFTLRQQLDDSTPEDPPARIQMYQQIIAHCQTAGAAMDVQEQRIGALRRLETSAPEALDALDAAIADLKSRLPDVRAALETLSGYAPTAWASVKGNPEEADKRGAFAEAQVQKGRAALAQTPPSNRDAASAARSAQEAVAQANQLLDAVEQLAKTLDDARGKMAGELDAAAADIQAARELTGSDKVDAALASQLAQANALVETARGQVTAAKPDPIVALKVAQNAHATADAALAGVRRAAEQRAREKAAFESARQMAATGIAQATAYLNARHTGIGATPRTRLAEAQRHLDSAVALAATDVAAATAEANTAISLADEAYGLARQDFEGLPYVGGFGGSVGTPGPSGSSGNSAAGAFLGALIGGFLSGGGRGGGGFGGSSWGSGGGWSGGGGGSSGGFGGFGGHSGGGGFGGFSSGGGGGGGHSGGGGW